MQEKRLRHFGGMMIKDQAFYQVALQSSYLPYLTVLTIYSVRNFPMPKSCGSRLTNMNNLV